MYASFLRRGPKRKRKRALLPLPSRLFHLRKASILTEKDLALARITPDQGQIEITKYLKIAINRAGACYRNLRLVLSILSVAQGVYRALVSATRASPDDGISAYSRLTPHYGTAPDDGVVQD